MEDNHDLDLEKRDDSTQQLEVVKKEDITIGDFEEMELTSKNYKIKNPKSKKNFVMIF